MKKNTWTTRDGEVISINEMSDSHIINTIGYFFKRAKSYKNNVVKMMIGDGMDALSYCGGEMAEMAAHSEGENLLDLAHGLRDLEAVIIPDSVENVVKEAYRRNLKMPEIFTPDYLTISSAIKLVNELRH